MIDAAIGELERAGVTERPEVALADARLLERAAHGRGDRQQAHPGADPPGLAAAERSPGPGWTGGRYSWMRTVLGSEHGKQLYRRRIQMIEPVFAHTKHNRHDHPIPPKRPNRRAYRVAITDGNPQPHQAPPPPTRRRRGLNRPGPDGSHRQTASRHPSPSARQGVTRQPRDTAIAAPTGIGRALCHERDHALAIDSVGHSRPIAEVADSRGQRALQGPSRGCSYHANSAARSTPSETAPSGRMRKRRRQGRGWHLHRQALGSAA